MLFILEHQLAASQGIPLKKTYFAHFNLADP
jgi:hypothetical protein